MANRFKVNTLVLNSQNVTTNNNRLMIGNSGVLYSGENYGGFTTSLALESTGTALQNQVNSALSTKVTGVSITGGIAITGAVNISAGSNITVTQAGSNTFSIASTAAGGSSYAGVTGLVITGSPAISGNVLITGSSGINVSLIGNLINISVAESSLTSITGGGNVSVFTSGNYLWISGNTGEYLNFYKTNNPNNFTQSGNLESTGTSLQNQITNALSTKVTGVSITGGISLTGAVNISAGTNVTLTQAGTNSFSVSATAGSTFVTGASGIVTYLSGTTIGIAPYPFSKSITVSLPAAGDDIGLFYTPRPLNLSALYATISGDTTPIVNYSLKFATGRFLNGTEVNINGLAVTSQNTGAQQFTFNNSYISGSTYTWLYINLTGGNPKQFGLTMYLNYV